MKASFIVAPLPAGNSQIVAATRTIGNSGKLFLKKSDGTVYHGGRGDIDLTAIWRCSRADRSAYAKLAGVKVADIEKATKARRAAEDLEDRKQEIFNMKKIAAKYGFKISGGKN